VTPFSRFRSQSSGNAVVQQSARYTHTVMSRCELDRACRERS